MPSAEFDGFHRRFPGVGSFLAEGWGEGGIFVATLSGRFCCLLGFCGLETIRPAFSLETASTNCVYFVSFILSVDETWDFVDCVDAGRGGFVDRFTISIEVLIGDFYGFCAAKVFDLVVYSAANVGWKLPQDHLLDDVIYRNAANALLY